MTEIKITMDEHGRLKVNLSEGLPIVVALGLMEITKNIIINKKENPAHQSEDEVTGGNL